MIYDVESIVPQKEKLLNLLILESSSHLGVMIVTQIRLNYLYIVIIFLWIPLLLRPILCS